MRGIFVGQLDGTLNARRSATSKASPVSCSRRVERLRKELPARRQQVVATVTEPASAPIAIILNWKPKACSAEGFSYFLQLRDIRRPTGYRG